MNVLIIGYGKMGREIEKFLLANGHTVAGIIDNESQRDLFQGNPDVAIEFTTPDTVCHNLLWCFQNNIPVVTGTTGWLHQLQTITEECSRFNGTILWGSNFSIGMNVFFVMNQKLTQFMNGFEHYTPSISETHHIHKIDKPSGTAITLAQDMIQYSTHIDRWVMDKHFADKGELPVYVSREGEVKGIHEVRFESPQDVISIRHEAISRVGFAMGAVMAARWVREKKGVFSFSQFFSGLLHSTKI
jgi:4-hydroxy-tetrahydrodipicolinate reductase